VCASERKTDKPLGGGLESLPGMRGGGHERFLIANKTKEAFEKAEARGHGWTGLLNFVYYHEWDPKVLGVYV
jgi:hypothetical protein